MNGKQYLLRSLWHRLNGWPEDPRKRPALGFPPKVYFLDGPLKGETRTDVPACVKYVAEIQNHGGAYVVIEYMWDTLYRNAEVAYMRLSPPRVDSGYALVTL